MNQSVQPIVPRTSQFFLKIKEQIKDLERRAPKAGKLRTKREALVLLQVQDQAAGKSQSMMKKKS